MPNVTDQTKEASFLKNVVGKCMHGGLGQYKNILDFYNSLFNVKRKRADDILTVDTPLDAISANFLKGREAAGWTLPSPSNPYFTGRDLKKILTAIYPLVPDPLGEDGTINSKVVSRLGGWMDEFFKTPDRHPRWKTDEAELFADDVYRCLDQAEAYARSRNAGKGIAWAKDAYALAIAGGVFGPEIAKCAPDAIADLRIGKGTPELKVEGGQKAGWQVQLVVVGHDLTDEPHVLATAELPLVTRRGDTIQVGADSREHLDSQRLFVKDGRLHVGISYASWSHLELRTGYCCVHATTLKPKCGTWVAQRGAQGQYKERAVKNEENVDLYSGDYLFFAEGLRSERDDAGRVKACRGLRFVKH